MFWCTQHVYLTSVFVFSADFNNCDISLSDIWTMICEALAAADYINHCRHKNSSLLIQPTLEPIETAALRPKPACLLLFFLLLTTIMTGQEGSLLAFVVVLTQSHMLKLFYVDVRVRVIFWSTSDLRVC
jgi:hypothetical protein